MFVRFLSLFLVSVVFSAPLFTKTSSTTNYWIKNAWTDNPSRDFFYYDAAGKICSVTIASNCVFEVPFSPTIPVLWAGTKTQRIVEYNGGIATPGSVIEYPDSFIYGGTHNTKYAAVFIRNMTGSPYCFSYTNPLYGLDSVEVPEGSALEIPCVTNNSTVTETTTNKSITGVVFGDRLVLRNASNFQKKGGFISFWLKNSTTTTATFWYTNADSVVQNVSVAANATVEVNYVSLYTNVWIGTATIKSVQSSGFLARGDFIVYTNTNAIETNTLNNQNIVFINPNPFSSKITINMFQNANVDIFNLNGQKIVSYLNTRQAEWIPLTESSGAYIVRTIIGEKVYSERINLVR